VGSVDSSNGATVSSVIDLNCVIPATRNDHVWVSLVEFTTEDSIRVSWKLSELLHSESKGLGRFVVYADLVVLATAGQQSTIWVEVHTVNMIVFVLDLLMQTLARGCVPMSNCAISRSSNQNVSRLKGS